MFTATTNMFVATLFFSWMGLCVKLVSRLPVHEVVFFRAWVALAISYALIRAKGISPWGSNKKFLILRGLFGTGALLGFFTALQNLTLATATTILNLSPVFTAIISSRLQGEKISPARWACFAAAFAGVVLIRGFESNADSLYIGIGVLAALSAACAYNCIAKLKGGEDSQVIIFYFPLVTVPLIAPYTVTHWQWPRGWEWLLLIAIGVLVQIAQYFMTMAYQFGKTSSVSIISYSGVLLALLYDLVIFKRPPEGLALAGIALVLVGVVTSTRLATEEV